MLLQEAAAERTIDRDFDQTAPHVHAKDTDCPTCAASHRAADGNLTGEISRPVSPAILEFRIQDLEKANESLTDLYTQACKERDAALERVLRFERFTAILANHLDALQQIAYPPQPRSDYPKAA